MNRIKDLYTLPTYSKLREESAALCLMSCEPENNLHTDGCRARQEQLRDCRRMMREAILEVEKDLASGDGPTVTRKRLGLDHEP